MTAQCKVETGASKKNNFQRTSGLRMGLDVLRTNRIQIKRKKSSVYCSSTGYTLI